MGACFHVTVLNEVGIRNQRVKFGGEFLRILLRLTNLSNIVISKFSANNFGL